MKESCETCEYSKKPSCPWEGSYHHRGDNGEKIGVCNAWTPNVQQLGEKIDHLIETIDKALSKSK